MYCLLKEALTSLEEQLFSRETLAHLFIITKHECRDRSTHRHVDGLLVGTVAGDGRPSMVNHVFKYLTLSTTFGSIAWFDRAMLLVLDTEK